MKNTLTVQQAIEQGYTECVPLHEEEGTINIQDCDFSKTYVLLEKEARPFQFSDTTINDLLLEYIQNQEEYYTESTTLDDIVSEFDFKEVTAALNEKMCAVKFLFPTEIQMIP